MVFCNILTGITYKEQNTVTILILIDGFLQYMVQVYNISNQQEVTILILIDGFLQYELRSL